MDFATTLTQRLVRIPSVSGNFDGQRAVQEECLSLLDGCSITRGTSERPWSLATTSDSPVVLFCCHTDTVPTGDGWTTPPFDGLISGDSLHGRGSVDMKGGLAAAATAVRFALDNGLSAGLLMTADEEIGTLGAADIASSSLSLSPQLVVIPEATDNKYSRGHRGVSWFTVRAHGVAGHGSMPHTGVNAISLLSEHVISRLSDAPIAHDDYLGSDSLNIGTIRGGEAQNMIPDLAELTIDTRVVKGADDIKAWLDATPPSIEVIQHFDMPPLKSDGLPQVMDQFTDLGPMPYFTDGSLLHPVLGNAPTVVWGPGDGTEMHTVDETLDVSSLRQAMENFTTVVRALG